MEVMRRGRADLGLDERTGSYEQDLVLRQPFGGGEGPGDDLPWRPVSAQGVYRDPHPGSRRALRLLGDFDGDGGAALVVAAVGTHAVRPVRLAAVRAGRQGRLSHRLVCPALIAPRVRRLLLGYCHVVTSRCS